MGNKTGQAEGTGGRLTNKRQQILADKLYLGLLDGPCALIGMNGNELGFIVRFPTGSAAVGMSACAAKALRQRCSTGCRGVGSQSDGQT